MNEILSDDTLRRIIRDQVSSVGVAMATELLEARKQIAEAQAEINILEQDFRIIGDQANKLTERAERAEAEAQSLAAAQCHKGYGDEHGNWRCAYQDRINELDNGLRWLTAMAWQGCTSVIDHHALGVHTNRIRQILRALGYDENTLKDQIPR